MFKFFRQLRQKFIQSGAVSRYIFYAIGEILLVVLGILIALKVNNWNQKNIETKDELKTLANLHVEFEKVNNTLSNTTAYFESGLSACMSLSLMCGVDAGVYDNRLVDSLINSSFNHYNIVISQPVLQKLLDSEQLTKMENDSLKNEILEYQQRIRSIAEISKLLSEWTRTEINTYLMKNGSLKNLDVFVGSPGFTERSTLFTNYNNLFNSLEFENLIQNKIFFIRICVNQLKRLQQGAAKIKDLTMRYVPSD